MRLTRKTILTLAILLGLTRDGNLYAEDLKEMFPYYLRQQVNDIDYRNQLVAELEQDLKTQ